MDLFILKLATQDDGQVDEMLILHSYEPPTQRVTNWRGFVAFGFLLPTISKPRLSKGESIAKLLYKQVKIIDCVIMNIQKMWIWLQIESKGSNMIALNQLQVLWNSSLKGFKL